MNNYNTQKTITINGKRLTAASIRKAAQVEANGGHSIALTPAGEVHWMDFDGDVKVFNAGALHRRTNFGGIVCFLEG